MKLENHKIRRKKEMIWNSRARTCFQFVETLKLYDDQELTVLFHSLETQTQSQIGKMIRRWRIHENIHSRNLTMLKIVIQCLSDLYPNFDSPLRCSLAISAH